MRMRRWEANPRDVDADLSNYRKTVGRTRAELDAAREERRRIEAVHALVRGHLAAHLANYRAEATAIDEGLAGLVARCAKLADDEVNVGGVGTRSATGGGGGRGMREALATLMTLRKEVMGATKNDVVSGAGGPTGEKGDLPKDWRAAGVGGVCAKASGGENDCGKGGATTTTMPLSSGWLLVGDEVIITSTGEEGIVVSIDGPKTRTNVSSASKNAEAMDKNDSLSSGNKGDNDDDAMDVDTPPNNEKDKYSEKHESNVTVEPGAISVKLEKSGLVRTYAPAEVDFNPEKLPPLAHLSHSALARRWNAIIQTALTNCVDHDVLAMTGYINSALVGGDAQDDAGVMKDDGSSSPKSVGQYGSLLAFGSGLVAAPDDLKNYPSVIPLDVLEETVRKVVYEADKPRVRLALFYLYLFIKLSP
jgi:hypothetical protein